MKFKQFFSQCVVVCLAVWSFWYSAEQDRIRISKKGGNYFKRITDGKIIRYSECTNKGEQPSDYWKDWKYLGDGTVYKANGTLQ